MLCTPAEVGRVRMVQEEGACVLLSQGVSSELREPRVGWLGELACGAGFLAVLAQQRRVDLLIVVWYGVAPL